jgi:hypothetical protein
LAGRGVDDASTFQYQYQYQYQYPYRFHDSISIVYALDPRREE